MKKKKRSRQQKLSALEIEVYEASRKQKLKGRKLERTNRQRKKRRKTHRPTNLPRARNPYTPLARVRVPMREIEEKWR
jgi:hypothetical protein